MAPSSKDLVKPIAITFPNRDPAGFSDAVKLKVEAYFAATGLARTATPAMVLKTIVLLVMTFGSYALILTNRFPPLVMLGLAVVIGVGFAGLGFAVAHDALHGAYSKSKRVNALLGRVFDLLGANGYMWQITHNVIHHTYTNIEGVDEDLTVSPLLRLSPASPLWGIHRFQHLYGFLAYAFSTIFWVFVKDYKYFMKKDLGPYQDKKHPTSEVVDLVVMKAVFYTWSIVIPLLVLDVPWWQFAIGYVVMHMTAGLILGVVFQLAHVVEGPEFATPDLEGRMADPWLLHEMATTANFGRDNWLLNQYVGGLNFQIEHHLFPKTCSVHYPAIAPIVEATAREHGVPYHAHPTLFAAMRSHANMLRRFGPEAWRNRSTESPTPVSA